jgi:hypothetical protein
MVEDSMPAVVTSIEKPASVTVIGQEAAAVVVSLLHASEMGTVSFGETVVCPRLFIVLPILVRLVRTPLTDRMLAEFN